MKEIKRVNGKELRKELRELEKLNIEYYKLHDKLDELNDVIYSHHDKTQQEINILMAETTQIENQLKKLWEKLSILELFKSVENGEQEDSQDLEIEKNDNFTTLTLIVTYKKFLPKKGIDTLGGRGEYKKMEVLEKFVIESKKLPENFESMKQNEQKNFILENGNWQQ